MSTLKFAEITFLFAKLVTDLLLSRSLLCTAVDAALNVVLNISLTEGDV